MVCKENRKSKSHSKPSLLGSVRQNKNTNLKKKSNKKPTKQQTQTSAN